MFKLVIQDDEGKTTVVPLIRDELTIGRKEGNTIRLTERNVSRRHARVIRQNGSITIEDLDSYNGIRVNGSRIQGKINLKESDRVQIGDYLIEIKSELSDKDTSNDATQPIERVDPMGNTPVPEAMSLSAAVTIPTPAPMHDLDSVATQPVPTLNETLKEPEAVAQQAQAAVQAVGHARLVVLSTNYAGRDFDLDKPAMVIGRTDDNDIWINHRSISRHHAKIVRENGRYAIVDLQSSNGVRVNGEEYGKVELRRADVIDLGHVRMRFVEPGEDFVFGRDAQAIDIEPERSSRAALWAVLAILVIAVSVGAFWIMRENDKKEPTSAKASTADEPQATVVDPPIIDAGQAIQEVDTPTTNKLELHLKAAADAIEGEEWATAHEEATKALELDPTSTRAQDYARQAKSELASELIYSNFEKCAKTDYRCIIDAFGKIDPLSVYRDKAQPKRDQARDAYTRDRLATARKLASRGKCDDIRRMAASEKYWEETKSALLSVKCQAESQQAATKPPPEEAVVRKPPPDEEEDPPVEKSAEAEKEAAVAVKEAQDAAKASQYGKALRLCEKALSLHKSQDATVVCAIASCNLRSEAKAKKYISRIRSANYKAMVRQLCLKNGVKIPP